MLLPAADTPVSLPDAAPKRLTKTEQRAAAEAAKIAADEAVIADLRKRFFADPLGFVMHAYDWKNDKKLQVTKLPAPWNLVYDSEFGPDAWQCRFLDDLGEEIRERNFDGTHSVDGIRMASVAGKGVGKSALVGWLTDFIIVTRPHCRGTVTAVTSTQLESKTWPEISKWTRRMQKHLDIDLFDITTGRGQMRIKHKYSKEPWFVTAQTCDPENSEAFAGQHAVDSTSFYIMDEASGIEDVIDDESEGGMTDGEPMKFVFGNPTRNTGFFKEIIAGVKRKSYDHTYQVDSRTVQITNKKQIQKWIDEKGYDSDWVKSNVRAMFPASSSMQLISTTDVDAAYGKHLRTHQFDFAPKILTLDNAWTGDDEGVIGLRQGLMYRILLTFPRNDNDGEIAAKLAMFEDEEGADGVIIDLGWGTGVYSFGKTMGRSWLLANFAGKSPDPGCLNLRAYGWVKARDWLKEGGAIPEDLVLYNDLIGPQIVGRADGKIQIESKDDTKSRGLPSPNRADALVLSFMIPVNRNPARSRAAIWRREARQNGKVRDHNPYERIGE